jgi:hypothetical protein
MDDATAASALVGFTRQLNGIAAPLRPSLTYGQGKEIARHAELTAQTGSRGTSQAARFWEAKSQLIRLSSTAAT